MYVNLLIELDFDNEHKEVVFMFNNIGTYVNVFDIGTYVNVFDLLVGHICYLLGLS